MADGASPFYFFYFFGAVILRTDPNTPVKANNTHCKIVPSSVCGQGGPEKKKKYVPGSKPARVFLCFFTP